MAVEGEAWLAGLRDVIRERRLDSGQTLFRQGDAVFGIFAVSAGRLRFVRHSRDGAEAVLHIARVGETCAEAALFSSVYHCDAVAELPSTIAIIPKEAVLAAFAADPAAAAAFMARLARQVQALRSRLELRNIRPAAERVLHFLRLSTPAGGAEITFDRPLKDVAAEIGLTHEAFYRALARLESGGSISRDGRNLRLLGPNTSA